MDSQKFSVLAEDLRKYLESRIDGYKISTVKGLSQAFAVTVSILVILLLVMCLLIALGFGIALTVGKFIGNYALGSFIVAGGFLLLAIIFFALRKRLFRNRFTRLFAGVFFEDNEGEED